MVGYLILVGLWCQPLVKRSNLSGQVLKAFPEQLFLQYRKLSIRTQEDITPGFWQQGCNQGCSPCTSHCVQLSPLCLPSHKAHSLSFW